MFDFRVLAAVLLILLAGCSGGTIQEETTTTPTSVETQEPTTTAPETTTQPTTEAATTAEKTTTEEISEPTVENPWDKQNVTVGVWNTANRSRDITPLVNETLAYWNGNASEHAQYNVTFVSTPNARDIDILVELVYRIEDCGDDTGDSDSTVGCAPVLESQSTPDDPTHVEVVAGYSNDSTTQILKHELGHVLGIEHNEEPIPLMEPESDHDYLKQTDAVNRTLPWRNSTLSVYISTENQTYKDTTREQVRHALSYFERGADGAVPKNVTFIETDNQSAADIEITFPNAVTCSDERNTKASCGLVWGYSTDTDDAMEYYSNSYIRIAGIDSDAIGWHVGYWLTYAFALDDDELPEPFIDADYDDRRDEWWEN